MKRTLCILCWVWLLVVSPPSAAGQEVSDLVQEALQSIQRGALDEGERKLEQALRELSQKLPFGVRKAVFVREKPAGFGMYNPRPGARFAPGEPLLLYVEPAHYGQRRAGEFQEIDVRADLRIAKPLGEALFSREGFGRFRFRSRAWIRELFFTFTVNLTGAPPADYVLGIRLLDIVSGKETDLTLPFSVAQ